MQITTALKRLAAALTVVTFLAGCTVAKPATTEQPPAEQAAPAPTEAEVPPKPRNTAAEQRIAEAAQKAAGKATVHADPVVIEQMATVIVEMGAEGTADKAAYKARVLDTIRTVANAAMKVAGVTKVHVTVQTDGTYGTPKGEFAATLFFQKDSLKNAAIWGNLISNDQMLLEAPLQTIHKDLN